VILDVGCQNRPRGDVSVDVSRASGANVIASVYLLPFRDDSFDVAYFHGLLHHLVSPTGAWKEILRVTRKMIYGDEPTNFDPKAYTDPTHVFHGFRRRQLKQICQLDGDISIRYSLVLPFSPILTIVGFKIARSSPTTQLRRPHFGQRQKGFTWIAPHSKQRRITSSLHWRTRYARERSVTEFELKTGDFDTKPTGSQLVKTYKPGKPAGYPVG
jgi:SAM-dependent methyltransferase